MNLLGQKIPYAGQIFLARVAHSIDLPRVLNKPVLATRSSFILRGQGFLGDRQLLTALSIVCTMHGN